MQEREKNKRKKKLSYHQKFNAEWDEFAAEDTLFRKLKKGKIGRDEYDELLLSGETAVDGKNSLANHKRGGNGDNDDDVYESRREFKASRQQAATAAGTGKVDYRKRNKAGRNSTGNVGANDKMGKKMFSYEKKLSWKSK